VIVTHAGSGNHTGSAVNTDCLSFHHIGLYKIVLRENISCVNIRLSDCIAYMLPKINAAIRNYFAGREKTL